MAAVAPEPSKIATSNVDALAVVGNPVAADLDNALADPAQEVTGHGILDDADFSKVFRYDVDEGVLCKLAGVHVA